jgi:hypothetical protein
MWRVAANMLNKPSLKADNSWPFSLGVGCRVSPHLRKTTDCEMLRGTSDLDRT